MTWTLLAHDAAQRALVLRAVILRTDWCVTAAFLIGFRLCMISSDSLKQSVSQEADLEVTRVWRCTANSIWKDFCYYYSRWRTNNGMEIKLCTPLLNCSPCEQQLLSALKWFDVRHCGDETSSISFSTAALSLFWLPVGTCSFFPFLFDPLSEGFWFLPRTASEHSVSSFLSAGGMHWDRVWVSTADHCYSSQSEQTLR